MYFKKLEIFGFKSFADKTVMNFEPGVTAIVGPNGCGKSNVFDSIRWVLGEQSMKELRGSSREDVIFNGTDKKPALGFAEVSLTFSNELRVLPIEYDEVTITRRLYRSGESAYLLNKTVVRLKDIQELLMGTGIGAEAYSLIQQGKVDLVVSAKPEERRMIFDEASGITKYKAKKKQALNKLNETENNLLRVNDIVQEVKRQIASIERQANKARRYKEQFEKLKRLEIKIAKYKINNFDKDKEEVETELHDLKEKESYLNEQIEECSAILTREINHLGDIEKKINEIQSQEIKLDGQVDLNNRQVGFNDERIEDLVRNSQKALLQKEQLLERCKQQEQKIREVEKVIADIHISLEQNSSQLKEKKEALSVLERSISEAKERIRDDEEKILTFSSQQVKFRNQLTDILKEMQGALARKRRLDIEYEKVLKEKQQVDEKLHNFELKINDVTEMISGLQESREKKSRFLAELNSRFFKLEENIKELDKKKMFFRSQKEFIEKLHTQYDDIPDPVIYGKLITDSAPEEHHTGIIGKVKEVRPISKEDMALFRDSLSDQENEQLYEIICETKFIELDPQQISIKIDEIAAEIEHLISEKEKLSENIDQQKGILQDIEFEIREREKQKSVFESQKQDVLAEEEKLNGELELVEYEIAEVKETISQSKEKEESANAELASVDQELEWCKGDIKDKQESIASRSQEKENILVLIAQLETEVNSSAGKLHDSEQNKQMFAETLAGWVEEISSIDREVEDQKIKGEEYKKGNQELRIKIDQIKEQREALRAELDELNIEKSDQGQKINEAREKMNSLEEENEIVHQRIQDIRLREQELNFNQKGIKDRLLQTYRINLDEMYEAKDCPMIIAYNKNIFDESKKIIFEEENIEDLNFQEVAQEIETLSKKCESFGTVNLAAVEEYEELKERFEFLTQQQSDLIEAKSHLMSTIRKINRSTRQMFMDTFTKVSEEFRIYFRMLFGGGEAQLVLLDPENVLESGIDIIARPPEKKLQNISLMSGGEKTLTAIALIFGVFKVNPSPFCVLDEIDAALDESNVGRFSYLLKDFAKIAQFIVITHNKKTISCANILYGITMPETGCSRVVSVKFHDKEKTGSKEEVSVGV